MGKTHRLYTNRHFMDDEATVNKSLLLLAKKISKRSVAAMLHTDVGQFRLHFHFPSLKISTEFAAKVCADVLKNKLSYKRIVKKYGKKGLEAIFSAKEFGRNNRNAELQDALNKYRFNTDSPKKLQDIAAIVGVSRGSLNHVINDMQKVGKVNYTSTIRQKREEQLKRLFLSGITSTKELVAITGDSESAVRKALANVGFGGRILKYPANVIELAGRLRERGMSWLEVAEIVQLPLLGIKTAYLSARGSIKPQEAQHHGK